MSRIAWGQLMHLGLHRMGLSPDRFWDLTPAELMVMAGSGAGEKASLSRSGLERLAASYPDSPRSQARRKE